MADFKAYLIRLTTNLNTLREREARHGSNAPVELLNQIEDHQTAIALTEQVIRGELAEAEWREALKPLLVSLNVFGDFFAPPVPMQRPPRAAHFTNRGQELEKLLADLQPGRVVTLCGPGGIGKTALAAEAVWRPEIATRFPDGMIFHNFYNQPQANLALEHVVASFGAEPRPTPASAALQVLAGRRALLVLDGTEDADNLSAVLEVAGNCGVLVTSRKRKDAVAERQDIQPLPTGEAVKLLRAWGREHAADTGAAEQICELVGRLPLAVRLVGKYLDEMGETAAEYLAWLVKTPLEALDQGWQRRESVPVLLAKSLTQVSETARQVLGVVGMLALAPFGSESVAVALGLDERQVKKSLGELVSYGLLSRPIFLPSSFTPHPYEVSHALIHTYAQERVQPKVETVRRLATYYTMLAEEESKKGLAGYQRLDAERAHMIRVLAACAERGEWEVVRSLVWAVEDYLDLQGYWMEQVQALEFGVKATQALNQRGNESAFLGNLGIIYRRLGQVERAIKYYEQALVITREIGDREGEGAWLGNLGIIYRNLGQVERAIEYYEQALSIKRETGDRRGEGIWLGNLGNMYRDLGQVEQAAEFYEQALVIAREIGDKGREGTKLGHLGYIYYTLGQLERAMEYHEQALAISREIGDRKNEGSQLGDLGSVYLDLGQAETAVGYYEQALAIARDIGDRRNEGRWLGGLGNVYSDLEEVKRAIEYYEQAIVIAREIGYRLGEAIPLHNMGALYKDQGNTSLARQYLEQALAIFETIKSPNAEESRKLLAELNNNAQGPEQ